MIKISKTLSAILALTSMFFVGLSTIAFKEKPSVKETQPNIIIVNFERKKYRQFIICKIASTNLNFLTNK